jgi:glycerophosphoryl diester phosphodiesterase
VSKRVRVYAHRGAAIECPENTMVSFKRALEHGADALEMDVHLTSDGHVVVSHDGDGLRMANVRGAIAATTLKDVQSWDAGWGFCDPQGGRPYAKAGHKIPALAEVLAEFPGIPINVDLKAEEPALVDAFLKVVRGRREEERVIAASFNRANLKQLRRQFYAGLTALAQSEVIELLVLPAFLWKRLPATGQAAQLPTRAGPLVLASRWVVERCRAAGIRLDFWTVNDPAQARALVALGVDGIMTDDPRAIVPAVRAAELGTVLPN